MYKFPLSLSRIFIKLKCDIWNNHIHVCARTQTRTHGVCVCIYKTRGQSWGNCVFEWLHSSLYRADNSYMLIYPNWISLILILSSFILCKAIILNRAGYKNEIKSCYVCIKIIQIRIEKYFDVYVYVSQRSNAFICC